MDNSKAFQLMLDKAIKCEPLTFRDFDRTKNVQDQLQEMVYGNAGVMLTYRLSKDIFSFQKSLGRKQIQKYQFHSMEQLWLAFVMKSLYSKIWDGDDWINLP